MKPRNHFPSFDKTVARRLQAVKEAEERFLRKRKAAQEECDCKEGMFTTIGRRSFIGGIAGGAAAVMTARVVKAQEAPPGAIWYEVDEEPWSELNDPVNRNGGYGTRSQFEAEVRWQFPTATDYSSWTMTPLEHGMGIVTPSGLHFERHHSGTPTIDPSTHKLLVHGMVERPTVYGMDQLKRFPAVSRFYFIECSGNSLTEWSEETALKTAQGAHGLTSTSEWTGVPLSTILDEVGVQDGAAWILAEGADGATMTRSIPLDKCWSDAMLAYGQNGEALRPEQGYPLRLLLPGWEGNTHIKWLRRLEVSDKPFMTREETSKYTDLLPSGKARQFSFEMEAKSVITFPSGEMKLPAPGFYEISGIAWSGRGKVRRVDISTDGGNTWYPAALDEPILPICHTRFRFPWQWDGQEAVLQSRCIDETGYVQPTLDELISARGMNGKFGSIYHLNKIQSWRVASDGSVSNAFV